MVMIGTNRQQAGLRGLQHHDMSSLTEITLQLIYKKLEEILAAIQEEKTLNQNDVFLRKEKIVSQDQFNKAMKEVMKLVNKKENK